MDLEVWMWVAFACFVVAMLLVDLLAFGRRGERIPFGRSVAWSIGWTVLGLGFAAFLWGWQGREPAGEYLAGYLLEKSLSIDNLFVFALVFAYFAVPAEYQRRALFWGIVGAIALRAIFILAGAALLDAFHYTIYVFGAFLVVTGLRLATHRDVEIHPERNPVLKLIGRFLPIGTEYHEDRLLARESARRVATPMLAALVTIAAFDIVFAVDSIPAVFAVTREPFIVYAANAFSLLGLGALYFVLVDMIERFRYLKPGLGAVLVFVGLKMALADVYDVPVHVSLAFIAVILTAAGVLSISRPLPHARPSEEQSPARNLRHDLAPADQDTAQDVVRQHQPSEERGHHPQGQTHVGRP